ncbi:RNA recognition motif domain-containing protein [Acaryochloris thomasi]|nr:RNA-binding protein [Acaryochloris thomasi]
MSIFVDNLPGDVTQDDLKTIFAEHGTVTGVLKISTPADIETEEEPRASAYVNMSTDVEERDAISVIDQSVWMGKTLKARKFKPRRG